MTLLDKKKLNSALTADLVGGGGGGHAQLALDLAQVDLGRRRRQRLDAGRLGQHGMITSLAL